MTRISLPQASSRDTLVALACWAKMHEVRGGILSFDSGQKPQTSCWDCKHARANPGTHHILCAKPCASVAGNPHGIERGWFMYPFNFDPVWRSNECANHEPIADSHAVSGAVSRVEQ